MTTTTVIQSNVISPTHKIVFDNIVKNENGLKKKILKCHQGYNRPYPGAAVLQQKLRKLVKYGLRGKRKVVLKKSNDNDSSRTYYLKEDDDLNASLFVKINNAKKVKKQGQTLKLLHRRKEILIATDLFLNSLLYSTNLTSAASVEHILKTKNLEVSTRRIQAIHTYIAQHVYSEPIHGPVQLTDDESDVDEFDPVEYSSVSSSTSGGDNEEDQQFEKKNNKDKQAKTKGNGVETQIGLPQPQPTFATIEEQSSKTNSEGEDEYEDQQSMLNLNQMDLASMISSKYKSNNNCKRKKITQENGEAVSFTNFFDSSDEEQLDLNSMFHHEQILYTEIENNNTTVTSTKTTTIADDAASTSLPNNAYIETTTVRTQQTEFLTKSPSTNHIVVPESCPEVAVDITTYVSDKTEAILRETSTTTANQYLHSTDETSMTNSELATIAAVVDVVSENISQHQPPTKIKKRKRRVFKPRENGNYCTRSRT